MVSACAHTTKCRSTTQPLICGLPTHTDRSNRQVFLSSQHLPHRAIDALARVRRAFRAAGADRALNVEALVVKDHPASVPLLLEQARLPAQAAEVQTHGRLDDGR